MMQNSVLILQPICKKEKSFIFKKSLLLIENKPKNANKQRSPCSLPCYQSLPEGFQIRKSEQIDTRL
jgi:hypothetical protein